MGFSLQIQVKPTDLRLGSYCLLKGKVHCSILHMKEKLVNFAWVYMRKMYR